MKEFKIYKNIFRYNVIGDSLKDEFQISYIDYIEEDYKEENSFFNLNTPQTFSTISAKVFAKTITDFETIKENRLNILTKKVLDFYVENFKHYDDLSISINDSINSIIHNINILSNESYKMNRFGPITNVLLPKPIYDKLGSFIINSARINYVLNDTSYHNDKIICLRLSKNISEMTGVSVFLDKNIFSDRYLKLRKIYKLMNKNIDYGDIKFKIIGLGEQLKYTGGIIKIKQND